VLPTRAPTRALPPTAARTARHRHLGSGSSRGTAVDVDYGGVSFEITQIDGVLDL
jgi:hypothetical protein